MSNSIWSLNEVTLAGRERPRLDRVSLEIPAGITAVMGSSGAGKSSLLGLLADFEKPDAGKIQFKRRSSSASLPLLWSPQDHGLWPQLTTEQHVDFVLPENSGCGRTAFQWLELFGLAELRNSMPDLLSQGERSRLAIARALASEAEVLILDEPLVHVDPLLAHRCWQVVSEHLQQRCTAAVFTTHDPDAVLKYAQNVICLDEGTITFSGNVQTLYHDPPSRELAWLLGPCNWLGHAELAGNIDSLTVAVDGFRCVRPAQLNLEKHSNGPFVVETILKTASLTELRLCHRQSERQTDVFTTQLCDDLCVGDAVQVGVHPSNALSDDAVSG